GDIVARGDVENLRLHALGIEGRERGLVEVAGDDVCALSLEALCHGQPESLSGAGDYDDLVLIAVHWAPAASGSVRATKAASSGSSALLQWRSKACSSVVSA